MIIYTREFEPITCVQFDEVTYSNAKKYNNFSIKVGNELLNLTVFEFTKYGDTRFIFWTDNEELALKIDGRPLPAQKAQVEEAISTLTKIKETIYD